MSYLNASYKLLEKKTAALVWTAAPLQPSRTLSGQVALGHLD